MRRVDSFYLRQIKQGGQLWLQPRNHGYCPLYLGKEIMNIINTVEWQGSAQKPIKDRMEFFFPPLKMCGTQRCTAKPAVSSQKDRVHYCTVHTTWLGEGENDKYRNMEHYSGPALQCNIRCLVLGTVQSCQKLDGVGPVDNRSSTD